MSSENLLDHIKSKQEPTVAEALNAIEAGLVKFLLVINRSEGAKALNMRTEAVTTNLTNKRKTIVKSLPTFIKGKENFDEILVDFDSLMDGIYGDREPGLEVDEVKIEETVEKVIEILRSPRLRGRKVIGYICRSNDPYRNQLNTALRMALSVLRPDLITRINFG